MVFRISDETVQPLGVLPNGSYFFVALAPGCHVLGAYPGEHSLRSSFGAIVVPANGVTPIRFESRFSGGTALEPVFRFALLPARDSTLNGEQALVITSDSALESSMSATQKADVLMQFRMSAVADLCD